MYVEEGGGHLIIHWNRYPGGTPIRGSERGGGGREVGGGHAPMCKESLESPSQSRDRNWRWSDYHHKKFKAETTV